MSRILMLNYEFPPLGGGGGVAAQQLARGLVEKGYQIDVITSHHRGLKKKEFIDGLHIYRVTTWGRKDAFTATIFSMVCFVFFGFIQGIKLCQHDKYIVINTHFVIPTGPVGWILSRIFHIKNILTIHGGDIYDPSKKSSPHRCVIWRMIIRFLLNQAEAVVAQSTNTKSNAMKYYRPSNKIEIVPLAYQPYDFNVLSRQQLGLNNNKHYLISIGRLINRKGFEHLINCLLYCESNTEVLIIGEGPERNKLQRCVVNLKLEERVHFLGYLPEEKKFQYLSAADIYILSSTHEGFGIVLQEAMQVGLPIIASNDGGQTDIISDGVSGFLVPPARPDILADKINILLSNTSLQNSMSLENKRRLSMFSINRIAKEYEKLF